MKKIIVILSMIFIQSALAASATETVNSLLPFGTFDGEDCRVRVTRTIRGNVKVNVRNPFEQMSFIVSKNDSYKYIPGHHFAVMTRTKSSRSLSSEYVFLSYSDKGLSVLVGRAFYSPENSYDRNIECTLY